MDRLEAYCLLMNRRIDFPLWSAERSAIDADLQNLLWGMTNSEYRAAYEEYRRRNPADWQPPDPRPG